MPGRPPIRLKESSRLPRAGAIQDLSTMVGVAKHIALEYRTSGRRAEGGRALCKKASSADALGTHHALEQVEAAAYENFACGAERNYTGYCNRELEREFDQQSTEADAEKRKHLVWEIDRKLQEDGARPMI